MTDRGWHLPRRELARLDPDRDAARMSFVNSESLYGHAFFVSGLATLNFARQVAVPSIAQLLYRNGHGDILENTRKRMNDTILFFDAIYRIGSGLDGDLERGLRAIDRLNEIHSRFPITQDDYRYTLATIIFEPQRVVERHHAKYSFTNEDRLAEFNFWSTVGERMNISDLPDTAAEFHQWMINYEVENYRYTEGGKRIVDALATDYADRWYPSRRQGRRVFFSMFDQLMSETFRVRPTTRKESVLNTIVIQAFFARNRYLPLRKRIWESDFDDEYGPGFDIEQIGPARDVALRQRQAAGETA